MRSSCHGRSWRPCASNHASRRGASVVIDRAWRQRRQRLDGPAVELAREPLDAHHGAQPALRQRALQVPRPDDRRHEEVGLHLELVGHLRAVAVALEQPLRRAVLEVAALGQRRALDPMRRVRLEPLGALERHAVPQRAAFHARVDERRAVGGRLEIAALFVSARNARVGVVVEVRQHGVDRLGRRVEPRIRLERVAAALRVTSSSSIVAATASALAPSAPSAAAARAALTARASRASGRARRPSRTSSRCPPRLPLRLPPRPAGARSPRRSGSTDGAATVPVTFSGSPCRRT